MNKTKLLTILISFFYLIFTNAQSENSIKGTNKFELSSYGEILYQHYDYGPNERATPNGSLNDNRAIVDIPRFVLEPEFHFNDDLKVDAEIEFEHRGTGSALELEYEEFGEYEFEGEQGGEVQLEEFFLAKRFSNAINLRAGVFPIPLTLLNESNEPLDYLSTVQPESESMILPTKWTETGIELYGKLLNLKYQLALVNGLDATGFSSINWIAGGHQGKFEQIRATNLATVARIDYQGIENLSFGAAVYFGNSSANRPKPEDMEGIDANVTIYSFHAQYISDPFIFRGDYIYGSLENSDIVSQRNARLSVNIQSPRSPVAKNAVAWYSEGGVNISNLLSLSKEYKVYPFLRYEHYNTMQKVEPGIFANPRFNRSVFTFGANLTWNDEIVLKLDYSSRNVGSGKYNTENTIGLELGFKTTFIK